MSSDRIKQDIQNESFARVYLLYGDEEMMKKQDRNRLMKAMVDPEDDMNLSRFDNENYSENELISIANTMPFLSEHRVILVTDSGAFKRSGILADRISEFPDSTHIIFCEKEVDTNNKLFKYVSEHGVAVKETAPDEESLKMMLAIALKRKNVMISEDAIVYLIQKVGVNMSMLQTEIDKLAAYCMDKGYAERADVDEICIENPENKIFVMLDSALEGNSEQAFYHYKNLLEAQEKPEHILSMMNSSVNRLYQVKALHQDGKSKDDIIAITKMQKFLYPKYLRMGQKKSEKNILSMLEFGLDLEHKFKTGNIDAETAIEFYIVKLAKM